MNELIQFWTNGYFIEPLLTITIIFVFFISIIKRKKHSQFKFFPFYLDAFVTLVEFFAFMYFFYHILKNAERKKLIKWLAIIVIATGILFILKAMFVKGYLRYRSLTNIYILESSIMLIPCYFYYREIFSLFPKTNLLQNANFWTVTGLGFYLICTLPITFVLAYLGNIDYTLYSSL